MKKMVLFLKMKIWFNLLLLKKILKNKLILIFKKVKLKKKILLKLMKMRKILLKKNLHLKILIIRKKKREGKRKKIKILKNLCLHSISSWNKTMMKLELNIPYWNQMKYVKKYLIYGRKLQRMKKTNIDSKKANWNWFFKTKFKNFHYLDSLIIKIKKKKKSIKKKL